MRLASLMILRRDHPEEFSDLVTIAGEQGFVPLQTDTASHVTAGGPRAVAVGGDARTVITGDSATYVAGDHLDFRDATFHDQVIGVQHVRNTYETRPGAPQPVVDDWPSAKDVGLLAHGVRPTRRAQGLPLLPPYVRRDADEAVRAALEQAGADGGLVVVLGEPFAGKTRTALEAAAEVLPDARVFTPARGEDMRALPAVLRGRPDRFVLWLDDLDTHLGDGLEPRLLAQLTGQGVVVLATLREDAYDDCRNTPRGRVLDLAHMVELPREWSEADRERAEIAGDARLTEAAHRSGVEGAAAYLSVGPLLWEEWQRARRADRHPRGHALVRAAIDLARCGLHGPISQDLLVKVHEAYYVVAGMERESVDDALAWAAEKRHGALRMLRRCGTRTWEVAPYLVETAVQDASFPAVDESVWRCALEAARGDAAYDFEVVARRAGEAFRSAADAGDRQAMFELGRLRETLGRDAEAERWFRRAAEAGQTEAAGRLGRLFVERGEAKDAEPFLEAAAESGDAGAATLLAKVLLERAGQWLQAGAAGQDLEAYHLLGDLHFGSGDDDGAWDCYISAATAGRTEIAISFARWHLVHNERETAKVWLQRAADAGSKPAARTLRHPADRPQSVEDAAEYFGDTDGYPLDIAHHGVVLEKLGRPDKARAQYEKAHASGDPYGAYRLAVLLEKQGKPDEAKTWYRKAAEMGHPAARKALDGNPDTVKE
ncbi:sel1 repeat family protein [Streptomyces sp. NBC_00124]|uniref:tetratricopeptide repeat protein n=1 Tax=Streptomyces sp. NBC_00124 TaxID=2975662 RepID=UPI002254DD6D|nr:tetratricopeptide repeat protein [Streptomyces sp. NBC_00124]MCX5363009.1 sel1 repeat family protein [Streptomyces sp. NBC_00124]